MANLLEREDIKLELLRLQNDGISFNQMEKDTGVSRRQITKFLRKETYKDWWASCEKPIAAGSFYDHHHKIVKLENKRFIITSAQNNTYVHSGFLQSLEVMAAELQAVIIVGTFSYNQSGFQNLQKGDGDWFDPKIVKYILNEPVQLASDLIFCGELNVIPTAVNPLSGFHSYTKSSSGIIPHAKVQLESLPTLKGSNPKMLYTTGAITQRNYIQKKAGQKASFHHVFGALYVEIDADGDWFVRQLIADTNSGEFYDLNTLYTRNGSIPGQTVEAINWGDIHAEKTDVLASNASFGPHSDSMLDVLRPKFQFIHDLYDANSRSHHHKNDHHTRFKLFIQQNESVEKEIAKTANMLHSMQRDWCQSVVVNSNHDRALLKWLNEADYRTDYINAKYFLQLQLECYKNMAANNTNFSIFQHAITSYNPAINAIFLKLDQSFKICGDDDNGIECGMHGDIGVSGSRGSATGFAKLATKTNVGHSHSARIYDGCYQAGTTSKLDMGYNQGPSTWSHSHIVTYPNGKRAIITLKNGKWR